MFEQKNAMKSRTIFLIALIATFLQGCLVKSLHPFYKPEDVVFKKELLNDWVDQDGGKWKINRHKENSTIYEMHSEGAGEKELAFLVHLFELDDNLYLDFVPYYPNGDDISIFDLHMTPTHSIAKLIIFNKNDVQIKWFNERWMRTLFDQNRIRIAHETVDEDDSTEKSYVLTAPTEELQKFIVKYGNEDEAFNDNNTVWLRLKRSI
jgi:ribosome biogenesis GTPase A